MLFNVLPPTGHGTTFYSQFSADSSTVPIFILKSTHYIYERICVGIISFKGWSWWRESGILCSITGISFREVESHQSMLLVSLPSSSLKSSSSSVFQSLDSLSLSLSPCKWVKMERERELLVVEYAEFTVLIVPFLACIQYSHNLKQTKAY